MGKAEDRLAIIEATSIYAHSIDQHKWDWTETIFADTVTLDFSTMIQKPPMQFSKNKIIYEMYKPFLESLHASQHLLSTHVVEFPEENQAVCWAYIQAQHVADPEEKQKWLVGARYKFDLKKEADKWLITGIQINYIWSEGSLPDEYFVPIVQPFQ